MFKFCLFAVVVVLAGACVASCQFWAALSLSSFASYLALTSWTADDEEEDSRTNYERQQGIPK